MLFANRRPVAQLSNAWKRTSYPALCSAMLGALHVFTRTTKNLQAETQTLRRPLPFAEQLHQLIFPQRRDCVAAVTARFVGRWNHDRAPLGNALDLALEDAEFGRINQVVGRVDGEKRRTNFLEVGSRNLGRQTRQWHQRVHEVGM